MGTRQKEQCDQRPGLPWEHAPLQEWIGGGRGWILGYTLGNWGKAEGLLERHQAGSWGRSELLPWAMKAVSRGVMSER